jgi:nucleotide-binding universal stress UspA family protein
MFRNILVPVDGSDFSKNALKTAVEIADKFNSRVTVLHVISRSLAEVIGPPEALPMINETTIKEWSKAGERVLEKTIESEGSTNVPLEKMLLWGNPSQIISEMIRKEHYDLVVLGSQGRSGIGEFFLGSVSERISRTVQCPVLIVKELKKA